MVRPNGATSISEGRIASLPFSISRALPVNALSSPPRMFRSSSGGKPERNNT